MAKDLAAYQDKKRRGEIVFAAGIGVLILGILLLVFNEGNALETLGLIVLGIAVITMIVGGVFYSQAVNKFKTEFLKDYFSETIENGEYYPKKGLQPQEVYECGFLKRADRFKSYDYLSGTIDGVNFRSSDCHLQEKQVRYVTRNGKRRRKVEYVTYFKGRVFNFDFNKNIDHPIQVLERFKPQDGNRYKKVELESIDFNKKFNTYSTDSHTVFYVITPHFMESLMKIEQNHPGKIGFSFMGPKMHFAINDGRGLFYIAPFKKIDEKLVDGFKEDVDKIYNIVDDLKLNHKIFKEES